MSTVRLFVNCCGNCWPVRVTRDARVCLLWSSIHVSACQLDDPVLQPAINVLCDPDTVNQQLVVHLHARQMMNRDKAFAASYEDFVSLIEDCDDLIELQQIRCKILAEVEQATAASAVKRCKGGAEVAEQVPEFSPLNTPNKTETLKARNLKRYIKQLTFAKLQCERRLRLLGAQLTDAAPLARSTASTSSSGSGADDNVPSFKTVMRNHSLRHQLELFLGQQGEAQVGLLKFWTATQELRRLERKAALALAGQLFYKYFQCSNPIMKVDKVIVEFIPSKTSDYKLAS